MIVKTLVTSTILLTAFTVNASAHSTRKFDRSLDQHSHRIEQGRKTGQITWREGRKLRAEQRNIERLRDAYRADGRFTRGERRDLRAKQEKASWHIVHEKYDGWRRWRFLPRVGR